ncbi:MAG: fumarate/nitrate reduction transcriptional regulator Fnr [Gammaproteobacteria bacterium]|nr:fumarate/nitrate reduction transcriptional regulator Fnr [Gammaproteobacteria bacterium]
MSSSKRASVVNIGKIKVACQECSLRELCLPLGLTDQDVSSIEKIVRRTTDLKKGEYLYRMGDELRGLFAINRGSVKTLEMGRDGDVQITGFHLPGELLGVDAISTDKHPCDAIALEATQVCEIPLDQLEELARQVPGLQKQLLRIMSREIVHDENMLMMLGKMSAEARLASALLSFSERFFRLGQSDTEFRLTMSRQDLGDYLGLALETVSRLFSRFQADGLIEAEGRQLRLLDMDGLRELAGEVVERKNGKRPAAS